MKTDLLKLQQSIDALSKLSVVSMLKKALDYDTRPQSKFNKYEALDIFETLQNTAHDSKGEQFDILDGKVQSQS